MPLLLMGLRHVNSRPIRPRPLSFACSRTGPHLPAFCCGLNGFPRATGANLGSTKPPWFAKNTKLGPSFISLKTALIRFSVRDQSGALGLMRSDADNCQSDCL